MTDTTTPAICRFDWHAFGSVVKTACREQRITQADLAQAVGITQKHLSQIVTGKVSPSVSMGVPASGAYLRAAIEPRGGVR